MIQELKLNKLVAPRLIEWQDFVPAAGNTLTVVSFFASGAMESQTRTALIWKFEDPDEQIIWNLRNTSAIPFEIKIDGSEVDGVRRMALILENGLDHSIWMSGFTQISVE